MQHSRAYNLTGETLTLKTYDYLTVTGTEWGIMIENRLEFVINRLNEAIEVSNGPLNSTPEQIENDYEKSYPYATGYTRAAMQGSIEELQEILNKIREDKIDCLFGSEYEKDINY